MQSIHRCVGGSALPAWVQSAATSLRRHGFAIVDDSLEESMVEKFREELASVPTNEMLPNVTIAPGMCLRKPNIFELDATTSLEGMKKWAPSIARFALNQQFADSLTMTAWMAQHDDEDACEDSLITKLRANTFNRWLAVKAQRNEGNGACFAAHVDAALNDIHDKRRLTAVLYLTPSSVECDPDNGGIRMLSWPFQFTQIATRSNRMILFWSKHMLHRVLPYFGEHPRMCVTVWLNLEGNASGKKCLPRTKGLDPHVTVPCDLNDRFWYDPSHWHYILHPIHRFLLAKRAASIEYEQSVVQAHDSNDPGVHELLYRNRIGISHIERMLFPWIDACDSTIPHLFNGKQNPLFETWNFNPNEFVKWDDI